MTRFLDLPIELLPAILRHIIKPHHLALCCLVNKSFSLFAIPQLYECIYIYAWHKHAKVKVGENKERRSQVHIKFWNATDTGYSKVVNLFTTLAERPDLAKRVKKLGIKFSLFPLTCL